MDEKQMTLREALNSVKQMGQEVIQRVEQFKIVWERDWERVLVEVSELEKKKDELKPLVVGLEAEIKEKKSTLAAVNKPLAELRSKLDSLEGGSGKTPSPFNQGK